MVPNQPVRFACGECQAVFHITVAPESEWAEWIDPSEYEGNPDIGEPTSCPFSGSVEIKAVQDRPTQIPGVQGD
ncbi:MAG TPA: hypothetical protein VNX28_03445 [Gemmataceae bacterium]|jgi:hypothetical protein|nr:hypothetical protein [Gemmataceae bacterium]